MAVLKKSKEEKKKKKEESEEEFVPGREPVQTSGSPKDKKAKQTRDLIGYLRDDKEMPSKKKKKS